MDHHWHYDYARLAWDTGFVFGNKNPSYLDKNKLSSFDVDRVVKERDIMLVEQYIPLVIHYVLEDDQAEILDRNFVKIFRVGQLAIEYLIFCKKYLDNTVVLLKKEITRLKQQLNVAKQYNEEIETHLTPNPRRDILMSVHRCGKCEKTFSSENYLNSHIKRRHNDENSIANDDGKMQSEIKELKERLNSTDKLLQQIHVSEQSIEKKVTEQTLVSEFENKFRSFREEVEHEIATLHLEKSMYEEKYTKLFNLILQTNEKPKVVLESIGTMTFKDDIPAKKELNINESEVKKITVEVSTQTEESEVVNLKQDAVQRLSISDSEGSYAQVKSFSDVNNDKQPEAKLKMHGEDTENKISTSIDMIKNQMQIFWEQMKQESSNRDKENQKKNDSLEQDSFEVVKPQVKPRTKLPNSVPVKIHQQPFNGAVKTKDNIQNLAECESTPAIQRELENGEWQSVPNQNNLILEVKAPKNFREKSSSETESIKISTISKKELIVPPQENNAKKSKIRLEPDSQKYIGQIAQIIHDRFLGTPSLFSTDITSQKLRRAMEILSTHPDFNKLELKHSLKPNVDKVHHLKIKTCRKTDTKTNIVRIGLKKHSRSSSEKISEPTTTQLVTIKNKSLYETDSETEGYLPQKKSVQNDIDEITSSEILNDNEDNGEIKFFSREDLPHNLAIKKKVVFQA